MNALDQDIFAMFEAALERVDREFAGLVIGNEAENFCAGANIAVVALGAQNQWWDQLEASVRTFQNLMKRVHVPAGPVPLRP